MAEDPLELRRLTRSLRGSVGSLRAAAEALASSPGPDEARRGRLLRVLVDESERLSDELEDLERLADSAPAAGVAAAPASDLIGRMVAAAISSGLRCEPAGSIPEVEVPAAALGLDAAARGYLEALRREIAVGACSVSTRLVDRHLLLDLAWAPEPAEVGHLVAWQGGALDGAGSAPGLREALRDLDGEAWFNLDRDERHAHLRLLVPVVTHAAATGA